MTDALRAEYTRVAYYYHKAGLTQDQIAKKMQMSRQRVNRILGDCLELGIVKISIEGAESTYYEQESALEQRYGLKAVRICDGRDPELVYGELGSTAGKYLAGIINNGDTIGFSRGRALSGLVDEMPPVTKSGLTVTQLMGSWNYQQSAVNVDDIVHRFAQKVGATASMLIAPVVVNSPALRRSIMQEPYFTQAYQVMRSSTIAVVGIGDMESKSVMPHMLPLTQEEAFRDYEEQNAVGEICAHFFDPSGRPIEAKLDDRIISISLEDYLAIPHRIGVAGTPAKLAAITGALRGGWINVLVTDADTAVALAGA